MIFFALVFVEQEFSENIFRSEGELMKITCHFQMLSVKQMVKLLRHVMLTPFSGSSQPG